jgi:hypothetical protein
MKIIICILLALHSFAHPYSKTVECAPKQFKKIAGTKIEIRTECEQEGNTFISKSVIEYKNGKQHGIERIYYGNTDRMRSLATYKNGLEEDSVHVWDSLGNLTCLGFYKHGMRIGKWETWYSGVGNPRESKNYNSKGKEEGPWQEWWANGNRKGDFAAMNGEIVSGTEYYFDGKPRIKYLSKYEPKRESFLNRKYIEAEAWAPDGSMAGKIVNGNGEWLLFPDGEDPKDQVVFREIYKDSLLIKAGKLDSAVSAKWKR